MKARDFEGKKAKNKKELRSGMYVAPPGTMFTIIEKYGGLKIQSEKCPCCGVSVYMTKVGIEDMEIIE